MLLGGQYMLDFLLGVAVSMGVAFAIATFYAMYKLCKLIKWVEDINDGFNRSYAEIYRTINDKNHEIYDYIEHDFRNNLLNELKK